jgi:hypothetical protein
MILDEAIQTIGFRGRASRDQVEEIVRWLHAFNWINNGSSRIYSDVMRTVAWRTVLTSPLGHDLSSIQFTLIGFVLITPEILFPSSPFNLKDKHFELCDPNHWQFDLHFDSASMAALFKTQYM